MREEGVVVSLSGVQVALQGRLLYAGNFAELKLWLMPDSDQYPQHLISGYSFAFAPCTITLWGSYSTCVKKLKFVLMKMRTELGERANLDYHLPTGHFSTCWLPTDSCEPAGSGVFV